VTVVIAIADKIIRLILYVVIAKQKMRFLSFLVIDVVLQFDLRKKKKNDCKLRVYFWQYHDIASSIMDMANHR